MANQAWKRLGEITSSYQNNQKTQNPSLNNNQYSNYYSKLYPWLTQESYNKMVKAVDSLGLTWDAKTNAMNNYYRSNVKTLVNDQTLKERDDVINRQAYEAAKANNKNSDAQLRMTEVVQLAKKKWGLQATANDQEVFDTMVQSLWAKGTDLAWKYLSWEDNEFLVATWLEDKKSINKKNNIDDPYYKIENKINWALKWDWGKLSTDWLKYVQWWKLILDATELAKAKWATWMSDWEIMKNVIKSSPKLQQKVKELQTIQRNLTDSDKNVLKGDTAWVTVGRAWFSILPWISLQLGDDAWMNISLVNDKPASYKDIQDLIDVKEKFGDNYVWEVGNVAKVFANQPIDTLKKKWNQILNEFDNIWTNMENFWNNIMPKQVVEAMQWREMTDDELEQYKQNVAAEYDARKNKNKEQVLKYNDKINKAFQKQVEQNLDPQIKEYYDDKTITELLALWDMQWVGYKQAQMMASNWDMLPNIVVTAVNTPAWLTMMFGDSYARESQDSFERLMNAGADYDQASWISKVVWVINGAVEVWLDRLFWWVETTASKNLKNAFMNNLTEEATKKWFWEILGNIAKKQAGSSLEEWAEEVIQEIVSNAAEMTIKDNPEFADLFKWTWEAFEWWVFNPMNLMAWWSDIAANKWNIQQSLLDASYDAWVTARNIVDAGENMQNNLREFMLDWAYNAGKGARNIVEWADKVKEFMSRKKWQNVTTENVESETVKENKSWVIDRITDWGAEKITNTVSAQDKLYKAQEPRMNILTRKKDLEKRREHSDRANQLIVQNGYVPTNTAERLEAHENTMKNIWNQVEDKINWWQEIIVDLSQIADVLDEYIQSQRDTKSTLTEWDLTKLEKESRALRGQKVSLPVAERLKQLYNAVINNRWEEKASDTMSNWLKKATHEIWVIEDNLLSEIPWEFQWLKNDFGALKDTYEDVFKADMKNQRKKSSWLTETYSRIEWIGDIANWLLWVVTWKWDLASIWKWATKFLVWKSLAKASDVDFLIEQWFKELAKQYGNNWNVNTNTTPTTPTVTEGVDQQVTATPKKKTSKKGLDKNQANSKTATETEYVNETPQDIDYQELADLENETNQDIDYEELAELENETAQRDARFEEDIEEENLKGLEENETPSWWLEEFETKSEIETLPADVSIEKEAKQVWEKRIAPDRVPRQQLTFDEWVNKIAENLETLAEYKKARDEIYSPEWYNDGEVYIRYNNLKKEFQNIMYWNNGFQFKSNKSKEFTDLWKNIVDNKDNKTALREVARNFYISKVKKDISKWYQFPIEVLEKIPWAKKALDARERYQKGLDTSFSAKDARIDYSEQDKIWAWIKSQDWKQVTKEQKEDIVKWIEDFGKTLWLDMKKFAKDRWLVYVHLHGWSPFLTKYAGLYRESTNTEWEKNISVSVGWAENVRYKDPKTNEWMTNKLNTTMSHELGHAMDFLIDNRLFSWDQKSMLRSKYNPVHRLREYYARWDEIVARAIEQYVAVENWQTNYYENVWEITSDAIDDPKWKEYFEEHWLDKYVKDHLKEIWSYYERPWYWSKPDYEKYVKPYVEEAFKNNFEEYKRAKR